ncbi:sulfatase-like hydrolase/transferase [Flavihumibacter sp. UBA7668]|uniref:sulfatase-like hydrolase/transferase n=1 Tax=Flavihumibacter sp. UBA7668 TaxID=1946542 RepID=UPI0025C40FB4|nr:sulfatase-like hydrolase/transferase [Flavihumibacter sp. UBA7668]
MKKLLLTISLAGSCLLYNGILYAQQQTAPNIIIILADDLGYSDVGFNGSKDIPTPGIDRIAKNGVTCTNGYVSFAVCGPSRAGLITGRYQDRFGFSRNPLYAPKDSTMGLPSSEQTMAALLKGAGYRTGILGKWHLGTHPSQHPNRKGFDEFYGFLDGGHHYFPELLVLRDHTESRSQNDGYKTKLIRNQQVAEETEYLTDAFSREAVQFVKSNAQQPFFLYLAYNAPHTPMQASENYLQRFSHIKDPKRRTYAAMVSAMDDGINALLNTLEELKLDDNTLIFFLSDNGGPTNDNASNNKPLRGAKGGYYEGGIRVPFAVQWKGVLPAGKVYDMPVISLDIFATAAALTKQQPINPIDGVNLLPYLTGTEKSPPHKALYWRGPRKELYAIRTVEDKLIIQEGSTELFDIRMDKEEKNNRAGSAGAALPALEQLLAAWKKGLVPPAFLGLLENEEYNKLHPDRFNFKK